MSIGVGKEGSKMSFFGKWTGAPNDWRSFTHCGRTFANVSSCHKFEWSKLKALR
jgi:hypothetical protein